MTSPDFLPKYLAWPFTYACLSYLILYTDATMADTVLPQLRTRSMDLTGRRRASSIRRRMKRSDPGTPEVAVHVLLPKIFGGQVVPFEEEGDSDQEYLSSPDSGDMVATPEDMDEIPTISLLNHDQGWEYDALSTFQLDIGLLPVASAAFSGDPCPSVSKTPRKIRRKNNLIGTSSSPMDAQVHYL